MVQEKYVNYSTILPYLKTCVCFVQQKNRKGILWQKNTFAFSVNQNASY